MRGSHVIIALIHIFLLFPATSHSAPVVAEVQNGLDGYDGCEDVHLFPDATHAGNIVDLSVGGADQFGYPNLVLIRFKNLQQILGETNILYAELRLYLKSEQAFVPTKISAYRVLQNWNETFMENSGTKGWSQFDEGKPWNGEGLSVADDNVGEDSWADRRMTPISTTTIDMGAGKWYSWDITDAMIAWHNAQWSEYGVVLIGEVKANSLKSFASSEEASQMLRPKLVITHMPPDLIQSVTSHDLANAADNDGVYKPGQEILVSAQALNSRTGLIGTYRIQSVGIQPGMPGSYDTGTRLLEDKLDGTYVTTWYTQGLAAGRYQVTVTLIDSASNRQNTNSSLIITLDSTPPVVESVSITPDQEIMTSREITLNLAATGAQWVYISGDLSEGDSVMRWIPYYPTIPVMLAPGDGRKSISVKFMDDASNESEETVLTTYLDELPPEIIGVSSADETNPLDSDGYYSPGQRVIITVEAGNQEERLAGRIAIVGAAYRLDDIPLIDAGDGRYTYLWDTTGVTDGTYAISATLTDTLGRSATHSDYEIVLNSRGPANPKIAVLNVAQFATSRDVMIALEAENAVEIFISGDIVDDANTFQWIPYRESMLVKLTDGDGSKRITARFRDASGSESQASTSVVLETSRPSPMEFGTLAVRENGTALMTLFFSEEIASINTPVFSITLESIADPARTVLITGFDSVITVDGDRLDIDLPADKMSEITDLGAISGRSMMFNLTLSAESVLDSASNGNPLARIERYRLDMVNPMALSKTELITDFVSPNSDGQKDLLQFSYVPAESGDVIARISRSGKTVAEYTFTSRIAGVKYEESVDLTAAGTVILDGVYDLVLLLDRNGTLKEMNEKPMSFFVDTVPPLIESIRPTDGSKIPGTFTMTMSVIDAHAIAEAYLTIDGDPNSRIDFRLDKNGSYVSSSPLNLTSGTREITVYATDEAGNSTGKTVVYEITGSTQPIISAHNYPNPFTSGAVTRIVVVTGVSFDRCEVVIYDASGNLVFRELYEWDPGEHIIEWNGRDLTGNPLARGIYLGKVIVGGQDKIWKIGIK